MLDNFLREILDAKRPWKNLKYALLALGYAILASVTIFLALDSFSTGTGHGFIRLIMLIYFGLTIVSAIYAFLACRNALKSLKTNKDSKNYIALVIGGLLLLGIGRQILLRLGM
jgi:hypothetical protein